MGEILRYEIMERLTRVRLMLDVEKLVTNGEGWDVASGVAVAHHLHDSQVANAPQLLTRTYLQAVVQRSPL